MSTLKKVLRWTWEFPQCGLGWILTKCYKAKYEYTYKDARVYSAKKMPGGISLGQYIIVNSRYLSKGYEDVIDHEYGHTHDSKWQGPIYLLLTGLPSIGWLLFRRVYNNFSSKILNYYWFYTERRADKFGGVKRNHEKFLG